MRFGATHAKATEELMAAGADLDIRDYSSGYSALDFAANRGHVEELKSILRYDRNVNACDSSWGLTPLHRVDEAARLVVLLLLEAGGDIEAECDDGLTPLFHAANERDTEIGSVRALLEGGEYINAYDKVGSTEDGDKSWDVVGKWEAEVDDYHQGDDDREANEERKADDQRIRRMLARAPTERSWRRRS